MRRAPGVQRTAEHTGERQHVVDLVREVAAAGRHDGGVLARFVGMDLRVGVGQREHDAIGRHRRDQLFGHDTGGQPEEHVGALQRLGHAAGQAVRIRLLGELGLMGVEVPAVPVQDALRVQHRDVANTLGQQGSSRMRCLRRRRRRSPRAARRCRGRAPWWHPSARRARRSRCRAGRRASPGSRAPRSARRSISKQRGAEMSSRFTAPNVGRSRTRVSTISSGSLVSSTIGIESRSPNALNSAHLPSITGSDAAGPMSPRPSTAVPSLTTATSRLAQVYRAAKRVVGGDRTADLSDARGVRDRQRALGVQRRLRRSTESLPPTWAAKISSS